MEITDYFKRKLAMHKISVNNPLVRLYLQKDKIIEQDGKYVRVKLED